MSLQQDVLQVGDRLISAIANGDTLGPLISAWIAVADRVDHAKSTGTLCPADARVAMTVAARVTDLTTTLVDLKAGSETIIDQFCAQVRDILLDDERTPEPTPKPPLRTSKRSCRPTTRRPAPSRTPSPPPPATHTSTTHDPRSLPLRHWFLDHLSFPYPSPSEKISIAKDCGITRAKVDSDMTNWRRRSGWTDMMVRFSGGDREVMKGMIEQLLKGTGEMVRGIGEAVEGVRRYLMGEAPKVELGWIEELPVVTRKSSAVNPRKRRSSTSEPEEELSDSDESEAYKPVPTLSRSNPSSTRQMPHIPSISSLSTTSTFVNPSDGNGKRTVSGSSRYSYATDSTFADGEESLPKSQPDQQSAAFTFTPLYASPYGLLPATTPQNNRKRPAEAPLVSDSAKTVRRLDPPFYHSPPSSAMSSLSYPPTPVNAEASGSHSAPHTAVRALSRASFHASHHSSVSGSGGTETSMSSPSSVEDIEANYIPYASFTSSGRVLQASSSSGSAVASGSGGGSGAVGGVRMGGRGGGEEVEGGGMGSWSTSAPLARPDWGVSQVRFSMPQGEYEFAPRLEGWVGGQ